ncbi:MAG: nicotinate-nucleotide adenylyltransferase [Gammaproteobacteria bacterium]|uniref:Probable nicotinate-nucleotide adenylyltransferase n=1 Tax=Candidatus Thiopontia autotrophica TaxID=2841688 RepID=A0A8J6TMU8_9GAMM|nr:nicotinate-nucleotide adenylyltransferase [Candidatus Thiopontia autotrophica]MBL6969508.1 nicotinate-nucleotide adenylyltransferase [Gammaproteobacteria bacterium]
MKPIGIFGGTFDPVHFGHLRPALEVCEGLDMDQVRFVPSRFPVHRGQPIAPLNDRIRWLQIAINEFPQFEVDLREVERDEPSWMVVTLESMAREFPDRPLCLIMGMDAFSKIGGWHRWKELFQYAHIVVTHRPGFEYPEGEEFDALLNEREAGQIEELHCLAADGGGKVIFFPVTPLEISSTGIREIVRDGGDSGLMVPEAIRDEINSCYRKN